MLSKLRVQPGELVGRFGSRRAAFGKGTRPRRQGVCTLPWTDMQIEVLSGILQALWQMHS